MLPRLIIAPAGATPPAPPRADAPGVESWREHDGSVCALAHADGAARWFHMLRVASYRFERDGPVTALAAPGATAAAIEDTFRRTLLPLLLQSRGLEVLHASAVRTRDGVVALCAPKETGKSTIAYALARRGHPLWADDAVAFEPDGAGGTRARALPFGLRLRPPSVAHFGDAGARAPSADVEPMTAAPLAAVVILVRDDALPAAGGVASRRLGGAEALTAALSNAYCFSFDDVERRGAMARSYLGLVRDTPIHEVRFRTGLDALPAIVETIEGLAAAGRTSVAGAAR